MKTPLTELTQQQRTLAWQRYQVLRPFLEEGVSLEQIAQQHAQTLRTMRRWVARYRAEGLAGLVRKGRADQGERRKLAPEMQKLVEGLALQKPPLSAALIHRKVRDLALSKGEPAPSYSLVYAVIRALPRALTTLAHEGSKAYSERFDLVHRREASGPNVIWQADHTLLDILLVREGNAPARPWLTTIVDDFSRAIAGYFLSFDAPCSLHTSLTLRQAIWRKEDPRWHVCGIPQMLYSDNGSDFTRSILSRSASISSSNCSTLSQASRAAAGASNASLRRSTRCSYASCLAMRRRKAQCVGSHN